MDCMNKNCSISGEERMVSCWLCLGNYHLKCSGLKARDADALSDNAKNLQWTCPNCRVIGIEFYNFFKSHKAEFDGIKKDFSSLQGKLTKYGELFSKFTNLDSFAASPRPKRKRTAKSSSTPPCIPKNTGVITTNNDSIPLPTANTSSCPAAVVTPNTNNFIPPHHTSNASNYNIIPSESTSVTPTVSNSSILPMIPNLATSKPPELILLTPSSSNIPTNLNVVNNPLTTVTPKPLKIIAPRKTIFASRFSVDTTINDVEFYIKTNLGIEDYNNVQIYKINARNRASFKIIVPESIFDRLVNPQFWPKNTIVRQFIYRDDNNVILPRASDPNPKN